MLAITNVTETFKKAFNSEGVLHDFDFNEISKILIDRFFGRMNASGYAYGLTLDEQVTAMYKAFTEALLFYLMYNIREVQPKDKKGKRSDKIIIHFHKAFGSLFIEDVQINCMVVSVHMLDINTGIINRIYARDLPLSVLQQALYCVIEEIRTNDDLQKHLIRLTTKTKNK